MRKGFTLIELMIVIAIIAIIASIAIPNLMESRVTANESAASGSLKSGVFAAQTSFQGGGNQDLDADNVGEFGTLKALAGIIATNKVASGSLHLLQGPLANSANWSGGTAAVPNATITQPAVGAANGYLFTSYIGSETVAATNAGADMWVEGNLAPTALITAGNSANHGESYWICACMPARFGDTGRRAFLITVDGQIRSPSRAHGTNAFFNATGANPANGTAGTAAGLDRGIAYGYDATNYPPSPAATTAAATQTMAITTFDSNATNGYEFYSK